VRPSGPWPTATTRPVVLLGWPARHSLSPVMHNAAFAEQGLDLVYLALPTPPAALGQIVDALAAVEAVGANVTIPHKQAVISRCDELTLEAELVGAVNTLAWSTDGLVGDNTDAVGLGEVLGGELGVGRDDAAVVLGTGGAARAAVVALGRLGCPVTVVGRRPEAAQDLAGLGEAAGSQEADALGLDGEAWVRAAVGRARLVVNATPLGMEGEELPSPFRALAPGQIAYDLIYNPPETPFLAAARAAGAEAHHGLGMLVGQAAASYRRWTGRDAPTATMSAAAMAALAG
jgi:shikimate dehydrogenase